MKTLSSKKKGDVILILLRIITLIEFISVFISRLNPSRLTSEILPHTSLFTSAVSFDAITGSVVMRLVDRGMFSVGMFYILLAGSAIIVLMSLMGMIGSMITLGNHRFRKVGTTISLIGEVAKISGLVLILVAYFRLKENIQTDRVTIFFPGVFWYYVVTTAVLIALSVVALLSVNGEKVEETAFEMKEKYTLFIYLLPSLIFTFLFSYLPLWGWRYAFFDYMPGDELTMANFVGFKWFRELLSDPATMSDFLLVMRNTLIMSALGILTSFLPALFAVFFSEIRSNPLRKVVQTLSTLPNFISWVLVYAFALAMFSTNGFLNTVIGIFTGTTPQVNYLQTDSGVWLKMLLWGVWKSIGWSAIIYIAAISGIDGQLYEAAVIDGAKRWDRIVNITIPSIMPTYSVMLLMSFAGILSNGLEQYLVFENPANKDKIRVLDLYVYRLGIGTDTGASALIPLSTVISMGKSIISVLLLFGANFISKKIRGESVI